MSYIVKTISTEDNNEIKKINSILMKIVNTNGKIMALEFIEKLEEKGFVICKKVVIDN
jgi:hypothetical protein